MVNKQRADWVTLLMSNSAPHIYGYQVLPHPSGQNFSTISTHADEGPRSRVWARETLRSATHRRELKFSGERVWSGGGPEIFKSFSDQLSRQIRQF